MLIIYVTHPKTWFLLHEGVLRNIKTGHTLLENQHVVLIGVIATEISYSNLTEVNVAHSSTLVFC